MDQSSRVKAAWRYPLLDDAQGFATAVLLVGFGLRFTWKTIVVVAGLSLSVEGIGKALGVHPAHPLFAAIAGGLLIGIGLLVLFRHGASLGGFGVLALLLQRRYGWMQRRRTRPW
jgi:uncharacterized membrane-anchored protein YitT (DUF2179 family)